jgi:hypothetical protein
VKEFESSTHTLRTKEGKKQQTSWTLMPPHPCASGVPITGVFRCTAPLRCFRCLCYLTFCIYSCDSCVRISSLLYVEKKKRA